MASERPLTLVNALKSGSWSAAQMAHHLDDDLLPDCPLPGVSTNYVWEGLRELQFAYQERYANWREIPGEFERLARVLPVLASMGA